MADTTPPDNFEFQPENDFEKISAPGSGFDQEGDGLLAAGDEPQDGEVSTTTDNAGSFLKGVDPRDSVDEDESSVQVLVDLIYWRDVKKTGVVFGAMLTVLLCLAIFSLVSVLAYLSLALLTVSFSFVVYKKIMGAVQKSNDGHPFKVLLEMDIDLKEEKLKTVIQTLLNNINKTVNELRRLFFIEDIVDSIKFGLMLWLSTYIGSLLNGITLVILAVILLFTLPKVYETYQVQIDQYVGQAKAQINNVLTIVQSKLPFLKKKDKAQ
ncbi:reticulon-1-A isoform X2 [Aplysia californica]|uniref:Reticulon-like protein n=1 Tax=Aplysia californica TaxID=6500 RepID=A0ABM0JJL7_APLCA|nr:reticulon-1-A isoform X2 [Aplysia californica]